MSFLRVNKEWLKKYEWLKILQVLSFMIETRLQLDFERTHNNC